MMISESCASLDTEILKCDGVVDMYSGVTATVFGATGFLGRYVVQLLGEGCIYANSQGTF